MKKAVSGLYAKAMKLRENLYDKDLLVSEKFKVPVISVGNITMGGTGKTPVADYLVKHFVSQGLKPAIVSRGYKRQGKGIAEVELGDDSARLFGDEPAMLKSKNPDVPIWVGARRVDVIKELMAKYDVDVIIADDAFQHLSLKRDVDIVLIDCLEPIKNYAVVPAGRGREHISGLKRAHCVVLTRANLVSEDQLKQIKTFVQKNTEAQIIEAHMALKFSQAGQSVEIKPDHSYTIVSAIGKPGSFEDLLKLHGVHIGRHFIYSDHHSFTPDEARQWGEEVFICTEKDWVKVRKLRTNFIIAELTVDLKSGAKEFLDELSRSLFS